ncbi:hypothetical protein U1Q18_008790 [Sarracenia purpurea var. burkii]
MATVKSQSILFLVLNLLVSLVLSNASAAVGGRKTEAAVIPGWWPIEDLNAPEVKELAKFALAEHNKKAGSSLEFGHVLRGETQAVSGTNYWLIIAAKDGAVSGTYDAIVLVKPSKHFKKLVSFKKL